MDPQQTLQALIGLSHERHSDERQGDDELAKRLLHLLTPESATALQNWLVSTVAPWPGSLTGSQLFDIINDLVFVTGALKDGGGLSATERICKVILIAAEVSRDTRSIARAQWGLANVRAKTRRHKEAIRLLETTAAAFEVSGRNFKEYGQDHAAHADLRRAALVLATLYTSVHGLGGDYSQLRVVESRCRSIAAELPQRQQHEVLGKLENNMETLARDMCDFQACEAHLIRSIYHAQQSGTPDSALVTRINLADIRSSYLGMDTLAEVDQALLDAVRLKNHLVVTQALPIKADILRRRGQYSEAFKCLDEVRSADEVSAGHQAIFARVKIPLYLELNRPSEAISLARQTLDAIEELDDLPEYYRHLTLQLQGELSLAEQSTGKARKQYLKLARQTLQKLRDRPQREYPKELLNDIQFAHIRLSKLEGNVAEAVGHLDELRANNQPLTPTQHALANTIRAELSLRNDPQAALHYLGTYGELDIAVALQLGPRRAVCEAMALEELGRHDDALKVCLTEIHNVDERLQLLSIDILRLGYANDKAPLYTLAQRLATVAGDYDLSLEVDSRQSVIPDRGAQMAVSSGQVDPELEQRKRELTDQLVRRAGDLQTGDPKTSTAKIRAELQDIHVQMSASPLQAPPPSTFVSVQEVTSNLDPEQAILWFQLEGDTIYAHVLTRARGRVTTVLGGRREVDDLNEQWQSYFQQNLQRSLLIQEYGVPDLRRMYQILIQPLLGDLEGTHTLYVKMPAQWDGLPIQAALSDEGHLLDHFNISRIGSLTDNLRKTHLASELAHGNCLLAADTNGDQLQETLREVRQIQSMLTHHTQVADVLSLDPEEHAGSRNTAHDIIKEKAKDLVLLHVAAHGEFQEDNPLFSYLHIGGRRIYALDFYHLNLRSSPLMVISACEGARHGSSGGAAVGLARAMRVAGAGGIIACQWKVSDSAARRVMEHFYSIWLTGELGAAAALCQAQRELAKELPIEDWAAFIFVQG